MSLILTIAALAGAAQGREVTGVRAGPTVVERNVASPSPGVSRAVLAEFSKCIVRRKHDDAARVVLDPAANLGKERATGLFISDCMPARSRMRATATQIRFGLAEALTLAEAGKLSFDFAGVAPLYHRPFNPPSLGDVRADPGRLSDLSLYPAEQAAFAAVSPFGECVVRAAPAQSLAVLRTRVETREESAALEALFPMLGKCLGKGQEMRLNRFVMRGTLALNLYRLARAPRVAVAGRVQ
jgi:hypothetical protein